MLQKKNPPKRSASFVPQLLAHLTTNERFTCKFTDLPASYRAQPYNLPAKLLARGGIEAKVAFSEEHDTFTIIKFGTRQTGKPAIKRKRKTNNHHV